MKLNYRVTVDVVVEIDESGAIFNPEEHDEDFVSERKQHGRELFNDVLRTGEFEPIVEHNVFDHIRNGDGLHKIEVPYPPRDLDDIAEALHGPAGDFFRKSIEGLPSTEENIESGCAGSCFWEDAEEVCVALFRDMKVVKVGIKKLDP